jgi:hypothetical protein
MKNSRITVRPPIIDRLVYVLPWLKHSSYTGQEQAIASVTRRFERLREAQQCERAYPRGGRYRLNIRIPLPGGDTAFAQFGALQPDRQNGGIRVSLNPARCDRKDVEHLHRVMRRLTGSEYSELLGQALLNSLDIAVDVHGVRLSHTLVAYQYAQHKTVFGKRIDGQGLVEGYNFGSTTSDYMTVAYDKHQERVHRAIQRLVSIGRTANESLKANAIKQLICTRDRTPYIRIEVRGKKLHGLPLSQLSTLANRFARFKFASLEGTETSLSPRAMQSFVSMCRDIGVKAALQTFKHDPDARRVNAFWRARQVSWWQPETLWAQACDAVHATGIFPDAAFEYVPPPKRTVSRPAAARRKR